MQKKQKQKLKGVLTGLTILTVGALYSCARQNPAVLVTAEETTVMETAAPAAEMETNAILWVHVCGAVRNAGVYQLPAGSRYQQAVEAAGGFTDEADTASLNLAAIVTDGEQILVLTREQAAARQASEAQATDGLININTAGKEELMTLPGIGEARAEAIIEYRETCGKFETIEDIMLVPGIKEGAYSKLKAKIKVGIGNGEQGFSSG